MIAVVPVELCLNFAVARKTLRPADFLSDVVTLGAILRSLQMLVSAGEIAGRKLTHRERRSQEYACNRHACEKTMEDAYVH